MNDLQVFESNEFGKLGVMLIDGKPYFPATACAKVLGYSNPQDAIRTHCKGVRKMLTPSNGGNQEVNYIPEGDLYRLIMRSKLPAAERFEAWVCDEVLPAIRRTGSYGNMPDMAVLTQIIAQTVRATIMELLPYITQDNRPPIAHGCPIPRKPTTIIQSMTSQQRSELDDMILSGQYTYGEIRSYFLEEHSVRFSLATLCGYANGMKMAIGQ